MTCALLRTIILLDDWGALRHTQWSRAVNVESVNRVFVGHLGENLKVDPCGKFLGAGEPTRLNGGRWRWRPGRISFHVPAQESAGQRP